MFLVGSILVEMRRVGEFLELWCLFSVVQKKQADSTFGFLKTASGASESKELLSAKGF